MSNPGTYAISGYITRANLVTPQPPLDILVDPYWPLLGDDEAAADFSMEPGIAPQQSAQKQVWANSPYVAGQQLVLAVPDNAVLDLRLIVHGDNMTQVETYLSHLIQAIRTQMAYTISVTIQTATFTWACFTGTYLVAFNQLFFFGYLLPVYLTCQRTPIPVAGPI